MTTMTAEQEAAYRAGARKVGGPRRQFPTPGSVARHCDTRTVDTPALDLIDAALVELANTPDGRLIVTMPPQEGKSSRVRDFLAWFMREHPAAANAIASYGESLARTHSRLIRDRLESHPELGLFVRHDVGAAGEWQTTGGGSMLAVGIGSGFTGRPVDGVLVIDDPTKDREAADSVVYRERAWSWWTEVAIPRLAPGTRVLIVLTRWHHDDLVGRLLKAEDGHLWSVLNIPAQADHDPAKGETDPLGREPGQFLESARGRSVEQWEARKVAVGSRTWTALFQGRPSPSLGTMFRRDQWRRYGQPQWIERADGSRWLPGTPAADLLMSWDMAFKDLDSSDYVVGQVWLRRGAESWLLDQTRARMDFPETLRQVRAMAARWPQVVLKLVEDKANGTAVIAMLRRSVPGLVPVEPDGSKVARAAAVSPLVEAGQVWLPAAALAPWSDDLIEEAAAFPHGTNDDQVDALSQALARLVVMPLSDAVPVEETDDVYDEGYLAPWPA